MNEYIAVIDSETSYADHVISIGLAIGNKNDFSLVKSYYYIIEEYYLEPAMYASELFIGLNGDVNKKVGYYKALREIKSILEEYNVEMIFAYNAGFDKYHLPQLHDYKWLDIANVAAYKQFNKCIDDKCECYSTGRLKRWCFERVYHLTINDKEYIETHNALGDAIDELEIMRVLNVDVSEYERKKK